MEKLKFFVETHFENGLYISHAELGLNESFVKGDPYIILIHFDPIKSAM